MEDVSTHISVGVPSKDGALMLVDKAVTNWDPSETCAKNGEPMPTDLPGNNMGPVSAGILSEDGLPILNGASAKCNESATNEEHVSTDLVSINVLPDVSYFLTFYKRSVSPCTIYYSI